MYHCQGTAVSKLGGRIAVQGTMVHTSINVVVIVQMEISPDGIMECTFIHTAQNSALILTTFSLLLVKTASSFQN